MLQLQKDFGCKVIHHDVVFCTVSQKVLKLKECGGLFIEGSIVSFSPILVKFQIPDSNNYYL